MSFYPSALHWAGEVLLVSVPSFLMAALFCPYIYEISIFLCEPIIRIYQCQYILISQPISPTYGSVHCTSLCPFDRMTLDAA